MGFITADRNQTILLGHCLDDFVEKDAKIRYITAVIDKLDLSKIYARYSAQGADSYEPKIMLAIIFLAFTESIYSTRKIEQYCKKHMDFIYASCNLKPDHTTIARFIQHNLDQMKDLFTQIILRAKQKGYANFKEVAIDGSKIRSASSKKKSYQESKIERYMAAIQKEIDSYLEELEKEQTLERKEELDIRVKQLKDKKDLLEVRRKEVKERKEKITKSYRESHQINIVEPDAYMMDLGYGKGYSPAYNAQISVDMGSQLITSPDVIQDRNDRQTFSKQHQNIEQTIGKPEEERKYITDNGYGSYEQLEYIKENKIDAYISYELPSEEEGTIKDKIEKIKVTGRKIKKEDFIYNKDNDTYKCPMGKSLNFYRRENNKSFKGRKYRTEGCSGCEIKSQCLASNNKKDKREISLDEKEYLIDDMKTKIRQEEQAKELFQKRKTSVEPVFGNIKQNMRYDRFKRRGLAKVNGEFALVCMAHNLNKLFRIITAKFSKTLFYFGSKGNNIGRLNLIFTVYGNRRHHEPNNYLYA
jgi:transposase